MPFDRAEKTSSILRSEHFRLVRLDSQRVNRCGYVPDYLTFFHRAIQSASQGVAKVLYGARRKPFLQRELSADLRKMTADELTEKINFRQRVEIGRQV
jgi:hypothetical protein